MLLPGPAPMRSPFPRPFLNLQRRDRNFRLNFYSHAAFSRARDIFGCCCSPPWDWKALVCVPVDSCRTVAITVHSLPAGRCGHREDASLHPPGLAPVLSIDLTMREDNPAIWRIPLGIFAALLGVGMLQSVPSLSPSKP